MSNFPRRYLWGQDNIRVAELIRACPSILKIVLKTRNEVLLLEQWLRHYLGIVPEGEKLIILDHMSTAPEVWEVYSRYADRILLIQYDGYVDTAHSLTKFRELYHALWDSCFFYTLVDTDEFLCFHDGEKLLWDGSIIAFLRRQHGTGVFTPLCLTNIFKKKDAFFFETSQSSSYLGEGKPLLNGAFIRQQLTRPVGHNSDLPLRLLEQARLGFVLLHLTHISRENRIQSNIQKLVNFGVLREGVSLGAVLCLDLNTVEVPQARTYIEELRQLMRIDDEAEETRQGLLRSHIEVAEDGSLTFVPESIRPAFLSLVDRRRSFFDAIGFDLSTARNKEASLREVLRNEP